MRIKDLTDLTTLADTDLVVVDDYQSSGVYTTKKMTVANLKSQLGVNYKELVCLINQTGTSDPTLTILANTTGATFTASRMVQGQYLIQSYIGGNSASIFNTNKTIITCTNYRYPYKIDMRVNTTDSILVGTYDSTSTDGILVNATLIIRIYE